MSGSAAAGNKRLRGTVVVVPIVHGSISFYLGKKSEEERTHKWTAYVRGLENRDLSYVVKSVEFLLHESFDPQKRVLSSPPFEVTESGWGEFEVNIKIHFKDNIEKPVEIFHLLRLFPPFGTEMSKKPVVSEHYDELIFQDPTENLFKILKAGPSAKFKISTYAPYFTSFDGQELKELKQIEEARKKLRHDKLTLEDKFNDLEVEREELARELTRLGGKM
mmetsp:Transcript_42964/g.168085  ORF Transcript_42964/g.168085 Transcript_42964/m.168085 type:complete len:220 (-) Transcript_42964:2881-3540(-)